MILDRTKAICLLQALDDYCKHKHIKLPKGKSVRLIALAKIIMGRYHGVVLIDKTGKFLCTNAKYLKKWILCESLSKESAMPTPNCNKLSKYNSL